MNEELKKQLEKEISEELKLLKTLTPGSEGHAKAAEDLSKLLKVYSDWYKAEDETVVKYKQLEIEKFKAEMDIANKDKQLALDKKHKFINIFLDLAKLGVPLACYGSMYVMGLKFEETGAITSTMLRNLLTKFKPVK